MSSVLRPMSGLSRQASSGAAAGSERRWSALDLPSTPRWGEDAEVEALEVCGAAEVRPAGTLRETLVQAGVARPEHEISTRQALGRPYRTSPKHVVRIHDGLVESRMCVALTPDGRYVADSVRTRRQAEENGYRFTAPLELAVPERELVSMTAPSILVGAPCPNNYFHWLLEALVRALLVRGLLPEGTQMLVPELTPMARDTLVTAGIHEEDLVELPRDRLVAVPELYVPPRGMEGGAHLLPHAVDALRSLAPVGASAARRLFISRASARWRRISNQDELLEMLAALGFVEVETERLSFAEQIALFAQAEVVLASHGAGLTNLAFCPDGALVVELQAPDLDNARRALYWNLAAVRQLRYVQVVCAHAPDQHDKPKSNRDILVDVAQLETALARHLVPSTA